MRSSAAIPLDGVLMKQEWELHGRLVSIIVPFFNEEANVGRCLREINQHIDTRRYRWEVVAVNDGSTDATLPCLLAAPPTDFDLVIVDLSRNFGKEAALSAGLAYAGGDAVIPLDADLQDPPQLIARLLEEWERGFEVVLARRLERPNDELIKRITARGFYWTVNRLSDVHIPENVGDFRLMDRCVVSALEALPENRRFMKGLFAWAGFRTTTIDYVRPERAGGRSKFDGWKLWNLALEGITSFSTVPLRIWTYLGFAIAAAAFVSGCYVIVRTLVHGVDVPGFATILTVELFIGGIQLIGLGVLGEYLGRVYAEAKRRPTYVVRRTHRRASDSVALADGTARIPDSAGRAASNATRRC